MNDFIAFRDGDQPQEHDPAGGFRFRSKELYDFLVQCIGSRVWMIVRRRAHYHLTGWSMISDVVRAPEGDCEVIGPGILFEPPFDLTALPWFSNFLRKRDHISSDFEQVDVLDMAPFWKLMAERERETGLPLKMSHVNLGSKSPVWKFPLSMMIYCNGCGEHFDIVVNRKEPEDHRCPACGKVHVFSLESLVQKAIEQSKKMVRKPPGRL